MPSEPQAGFQKSSQQKDTGVLSHQSALAEALKEYRSLYGDFHCSMFEQEMNCSFNAGVIGSFYACVR